MGNKFCFNCGCKLIENAKFCSECGQKVEAVSASNNNQINFQTAMDKASVQFLADKFVNEIKETVFDYYNKGIEVVKSGLYGKGSNYGITKEQIDEVVAAYKDSLKNSEQYLDSIFKNGRSLLLEVTDSVKSECVSSFIAMGMLYEHAEQFFDNYIEKNDIETKSMLLCKSLISYRLNGQFTVEFPESWTVDQNKDFDNNEYARLKDATNQIKGLQELIYEKSGKNELSDEDKNKIYELAFSLGFESIEMACNCIYGNEITLGLRLPAKEQIKKNAMKQNMDRFADVIPTKSGVVLGKTIYIESCFNIESFTKDYFNSILEPNEKKLFNALEQMNEADHALSDKFYDLTVKIGEGIEYRIVDFANILKLPKNVCDAVIADWETLIDVPIMVYTTAMSELDKVDQSLVQSYSEKKLEKDTRQRWRINERGISIKEAINSAVAESLLDAATALAYDAKHAVEADIEEKNAASRRRKILNTVKEFIIKEYSAYKDIIPRSFLMHIEEEYPYSVWSIDYNLAEARDEMAKRFDYRDIKFAQLSDTELFDYLKIFSNDKKAKKEIVKRVTEQKNYDRVLDELKTLESLNMADIPSAFEFFVDRITHSDFTLERQCKELHAFETKFNYLRGKVQNEIYGSYIESCIISDDIKSYDPQIIKGICDKLKSFSKEYSFDTDKYKKWIQKEVFVLKKLDINSKDMDVLKANIEQLEIISKELNLNLKKVINEQKQRIENIELQRLEEEKRKVDVYTDYDISKKVFNSKWITADSLDAKKQIEYDKEKISDDCKKLSLNMTRGNFDGIIKSISGYNTSKLFDLLIENLKKKWTLIEKHQSDLKKQLIEKYGSEENVQRLKEEEIAALSIYNNNSLSETEKYAELQVLKCTMYNKQDILEKQRQRLLERIRTLEENTKHGTGNEMPMVYYFKDFIPIKCIVVTIIGIVAFLFFSSWLLRILDILIVAGVWGEFFDDLKSTIRDLKNRKERIKKQKEDLCAKKAELDHFYDTFNVVNGQIVSKK